MNMLSHNNVTKLYTFFEDSNAIYLAQASAD